MSSTGSGQWQQLGEPAPASLSEVRLQAHWAAQAASLVGRALIEKRSDDSHTNLEWLAEGAWLCSEPINASESFRVALRPGDLSLHVIGGDGQSRASLGLDGNTREAAHGWLAEQLNPLLKSSSLILPELPYELPEHGVTAGAAFSATPSAAFEELARWYANADSVLRQLVAQTDGAAPVRCWPHHFDIATLITIEQGSDPESSRTIGVGMTPGDGNYAEPYWYVTPWPYPKDVTLPHLEGAGHWHQEGWLGAVLTADELVGADAQAEQLDGFLSQALAACRSMLAKG